MNRVNHTAPLSYGPMTNTATHIRAGMGVASIKPFPTHSPNQAGHLWE